MCARRVKILEKQRIARGDGRQKQESVVGLAVVVFLSNFDMRLSRRKYFLRFLLLW